MKCVYCSLLLVAISAFILPGCGGSRLLLEKEALARLPSTPDAAHRIIYFDKSFTYTLDGKLLEKTYQILRVGDDPGSFPTTLSVPDDSNRKLLAVEGRVTHKAGSTETFSTGNFFTQNLSNRQMIAETYSKWARIRDKVATGDLVETVSVHEQILPQLGILFSFEELEYPAGNITCSIEIGPSDSLRYKVVNSPVVPAIHDSISGKRFMFHWDSYRPSLRRRNVFEKVNDSPQILATRMPQSWQSFGDWYLGLAGPKLQPGQALADTARSITAGKTTPKEKMDAIFEYCQRVVRYERVYLGLGEIVPNGVDAVFTRKYGDCKDYAGLMHAMATSVGLHPHLALCHRGRGRQFFDDAPVSQFNHCVLHFEDGGREYWYDGTNRVGLPGLTTFDLANARALVLEKGNSHLATIEESPDNNLGVTGDLSAQEDGSLNGDVTITLSHQYAIEFFWMAYHMNKVEMNDEVKLSLRKLLNDNIVVDSVRWAAERGTFTINASCELPNSVTTLRDRSFVSMARVFPNLLPADLEDAKQRGMFYFPWYNRVAVDLRFTRSARGHMVAGVLQPTRLQLRYQLAAGPFTELNREGSLAQMDSVVSNHSRLYRLDEISTP